ncbi:hypothetical protein CDD82_4895 [Ophiocordyceps australis]|uniref:PKS/mFAS DH domain-containing protein n=1 Tax=Ophiocordyceps australis TaxID=1399860 RepID=A0A2C5Z0M3_9HYPO|nr:hypothetical protein CDD82_4895 [Ophiocordyceps australis]
MGHPLSTAVQIGLVDILKSWSIIPDLVLGHSSGEMAAAYASGAMSAEAAMAAAFFRSTTTPERNGSMAAIGIGRQEIGPYLKPGVVVACENSQCNVTISGDAEQVDKVILKVQQEQPEVVARHLRVKKAFHSHHMLQHGALYQETLEPYVKSISPKIAFYSSVTGERLSGDGCLDPPYWRSNMESPVLFNTALRSALFSAKDGPYFFIEIGPHPALQGPVRQILRDVGRSHDAYAGTLQRSKGCQVSLLDLGGKMFQQNASLDFSALCPAGRLVRNLPRYCWNQDTAYWAEPRIAHEWRFRAHAPHHLLGTRAIELSNEPSWRNKLVLANVPWLAGHEVNGQIVFPAAGYISMIGEALGQLHGDLGYSLKHVKIAAGLVLEHNKAVELVTTISKDSLLEYSSWYAFKISSYDGEKWIQHCAGQARPSFDKSVNLDAPEPIALARKVHDWYKVLNRVGLNYTGRFRGLQNLSSATDKNVATATVPSQDMADGTKYAMHPAIIDQCLQVLIVAACRGLGRNCRTSAMPTFIQEIVICPMEENEQSKDLRVTANTNNMNAGSFIGDVTAQNSGKVMLSLRGLKASPLTKDDTADKSLPVVSQLEWRPHADFVDFEAYMHPQTEVPREWALLEELVILCILDHRENIELTDTTPVHLAKFYSWMKSHIENYESGLNKFLSRHLELSQSTREKRLARIQEIVAHGEASQYPAYFTAIHRLFKTANSIFHGSTHPLHILIEDGLLSQIYDLSTKLDVSELIQVISHTNPRLRILEVGAGTGGTTLNVLNALKSSQGERLYRSYVFTDISAGFNKAAKERFAQFDGIEYATLDISRDPIEQGFQEGGYDLVIGSN